MSRPFSSLRILPLAVLALGFVVAGCDEDVERSSPTAPDLAMGPDKACDLNDEIKAARDYFPGKGKGSIESQATDLLQQMEVACDSGDAVLYTSLSFDLFELFELVVSDGSAEGTPSHGGFVLAGSTTLLTEGGTPIFQPCGTDPDCVTFDPDVPADDPAALQAFFAAALDDGGTWAVIDPATDVGTVCSDHRFPCGLIDPDPFADGETWGLGPGPSNGSDDGSWSAVLSGREYVVLGAPLDVSTSATGEALLSVLFGAYEFNLIGHPTAPFAEQPIAGFCTRVESTLGIEAVQHDNTGAEEESIAHWCGTGGVHAQADEGSWLDRLVRFARGLIDPTPRPVYAVATVFNSPGGGLGDLDSEFFAIDADAEGVLEFLNAIPDVTVGEEFHVEIQARTQNGTALEKVEVAVFLRDNNGLVPAGGSLTGSGCDAGTNLCIVETSGDETDNPATPEIESGIAAFDLKIEDKTGGFELCAIEADPGDSSPFQFQQVCSNKFNVRPN